MPSRKTVAKPETQNPQKPLKALGNKVPLPKHPEASILEAISWRARNSDGVFTNCSLRFTCPEFTSLCPVTGQPDFATIIIDYIPKQRIIESKSLKLYMASYREHKSYHEEATMQIGRDFVSVCHPLWMRIAAFWYPRGGIPIDVVWEHGSRHSIFTLPLDYKHFRG